MTKNINWGSPVDNAGQWQGFNDSGVMGFNGSQYKSVSREMTQNVNDARRGEEPAHIEFASLDVPASDFPDIDVFTDILGRCAAVTTEGPKAEAFFANAIVKIARPTIPVLQVSDFNTLGLQGPSRLGMPAHTFLKAKGTSSKPNDVASGSFGIGKNAPFTLSEYRAVLVSTVYHDQEGYHSLVQGKAILMSHFADGGEIQTGDVYWGQTEGFQPVYDNADVPAWLVRGDGELSEITQGTTVNILGFKRVENWDKLIAGYVVQSFLGSIIDGNLTLKVGEIDINASTLKDVIDSEDVAKAVEEDDGSAESLILARNYHEALTSDRAIIEVKDLPTLGRVQVRIVVGKDQPKKVAFIRRGMLITDDMKGLKKFSMMKPFTCVVEPLDEKGNVILRQMEPPAHDAFEPSRLEERAPEGKRALKEIEDFVREALKTHAGVKACEETNITELSEYLADVADDDRGDLGELNFDGVLNIHDETEFMRSGGRKSGSVTLGDLDGDGEDDISMGGHPEPENDIDDTNPEPLPGPEAASNGVGTSRPGAAGEGEQKVENRGDAKKQVRMKLPHRGIMSGSRRFRFEFMVSEPVEAELCFERVGLADNTPLTVTACSNGEVVDGKVRVQITPDNQSFEVAFAADFRGSVRMLANAV